MSKRKTAATLVSVAVLLTATAAANSFARNARDFGRGYREGYRAATGGTPAALTTAGHESGRPFRAGYERGRVEAARRAPAAHDSAAPNAAPTSATNASASVE